MTPAEFKSEIPVEVSVEPVTVVETQPCVEGQQTEEKKEE